MTSVCTTIVILLFMVTHCVQAVAVRIIPYEYTTSRKIWGILGGGSIAE